MELAASMNAPRAKMGIGSNCARQETAKMVYQKPDKGLHLAEHLSARKWQASETCVKHKVLAPGVLTPDQMKESRPTNLNIPQAVRGKSFQFA
jgi:hypothetical protein